MLADFLSIIEDEHLQQQRLASSFETAKYEARGCGPCSEPANTVSSINHAGKCNTFSSSQFLVHMSYGMQIEEINANKLFMS